MARKGRDERGNSRSLETPWRSLKENVRGNREKESAHSAALNHDCPNRGDVR